MNRFNTSEKANMLRKAVKFLPLIMGVIVIAVFLLGVNYVSESSLEGQQESLEKAISRDVAQCYAVEGSYPPNLEYLVDHYGLTYNEELFYVDYQSIGSNIYPDVTIINLNKEE
ncbi:MAG: hypothetical protein K6G12_10905 [Lachnospiraceae bacterium]|nr:hypothetical protein [Lachnospiraceae bacterium]